MPPKKCVQSIGSVSNAVPKPRATPSQFKRPINKNTASVINRSCLANEQCSLFSPTSMGTYLENSANTISTTAPTNPYSLRQIGKPKKRSANFELLEIAL